jgi:iron complex outermembrane receptor protein
MLSRISARSKSANGSHRSPFASACALLAGALIIPMSMPAFAQSDDDESGPAGLEEIVVTASKRGATSSQDLAASIVTFDTDTLQKMGVEVFVDFSRSTPGLDVIDTGPGQKQYLIRGLSGPGEGTVGVYYDSIPMSGTGQDPVSFGANQPDLDMFDTERVEVLRGPQGTQYGASSLSGVVRIVSNKPDASGGTYGKIFADGSATDGGDPNYAIKGMINLPLVDDVFALRATAYYDKLGGFIDNAVLFKGPEDNSCYGPGTDFGSTEPEVILNPACQDGVSNFTNINEHERKGGRLFAQWNTSDSSSLLFQIFFQNMTSGGRNASNPVDSLYEGFGPPFIVGGNNFFTPAVGDLNTNVRGHEPYEEDMTIFGLEYNHDFSKASLTVAANMMQRDALSNLDSSSPARLHRRFHDTPLGPWGGVSVTPFDRILVVQELETEMFTIEARLASQLEGKFNYLVGAYYSDRELLVDSKALATDPRTGYLLDDAPYLDRNAKNDTDMTAIFGEVYFDITGSLELLLGARWFETNRDQFSDLVVPFLRSPIIGGPPGVEPNTPATESDTIYKAQATYRFTDDVSSYLTYSEGFRAGGVNAQITPNIPDSFGFDSTSNVELGFKSFFMDSRMILNVALYQIDWDHSQMSASFTSQFNGLVNCDQEKDAIRSEGIELDWQFAITENVVTGINYTKMDSTWQVDADDCVSQEVLDELSDPFGAVAGDSLTGVPDYSGSAFLQWDWVMGRGTGAYIRADVQFQGEVSVNQSRAERNIPSPAYVFGHIKYGMDWERFSAALYVRNVTNETAWLSMFNNFQQENRVTVNQPRTIGLNLEMRF